MRVVGLALLCLIPACSSGTGGADLDDSLYAAVARRAGIQPVRESTGSELAERKFAEDLDNYLGSLVGKQALLRLTVEDVTEQGVRFSREVFPAVSEAEGGRGVRKYAAFYFYFNQGDTAEREPKARGDLSQPAFLPSGWLPPGVALEGVRRGDRFAVSGAVAKVLKVNPFEPPWYAGDPFTLVLTRVKVTRSK